MIIIFLVRGKVKNMCRNRPVSGKKYAQLTQ